MQTRKIKIIIILSFFVLFVSCIALWKICFSSSVVSDLNKYSDTNHKAYTYVEMDRILQQGMTKQEIINQFGKPFIESANSIKYVSFSILLTQKDEKEYGKVYPIGFEVMFDDKNKVTEWHKIHSFSLKKTEPISKETFENYKKAAAAGNPQAQYNLGMCYFNGEYVAKDYSEAENWLVKAAAQGYKQADTMLDNLNLRELIKNDKSRKVQGSAL